MTHTDARELRRLAENLTRCARLLGEDDGTDVAPPAEVERVRTILLHTATDLSRHAATVRRLDDEIDLLSRRRDGSRDLAETRRRRAHAEARLHGALDAATRALIPGGDTLDPMAILRRLSGSTNPMPRSYFGRPPVDRAARVRRLTSLLLRGTPHPVAPRVEHRPVSVVVPSRTARLARIRHRLRAISPSRPTSGARP